MAEAFLVQMAGDNIDAESAGFEPNKKVNPLVVEVMKEVGVDLTAKKPQSVFEFYKEGKLYEHIITVCHEGEAKCPVFPGITKRWHMPFPDPSRVEGTKEEQLNEVRKIRDMIKDWLQNPPEGSFNYKQLA
ncbi:MAG: arsenate reductase [Candidatus Magnetoglobus multicellularis str. Araruama]|uniref:Arsenate reductase n=1 Tax=Candidatus Magnetoglobus multicellularis str. Araruama TaxID=890399 RepID=A0A1V1PH89_9BACT|nr:MAG: arsenate reductase [Candidatus Magnetoglobus multicellularis str. Araruama]